MAPSRLQLEKLAGCEDRGSPVFINENRGVYCSIKNEAAAPKITNVDQHGIKLVQKSIKYYRCVKSGFPYDHNRLTVTRCVTAERGLVDGGLAWEVALLPKWNRFVFTVICDNMRLDLRTTRWVPIRFHGWHLFFRWCWCNEYVGPHQNAISLVGISLVWFKNTGEFDTWRQKGLMGMFQISPDVRVHMRGCFWGRFRDTQHGT